MAAQPLLRSKQKEEAINGISTHVVCTQFDNYILIILTQYGTIGTLVSVTPDHRSADIGNTTFTTKVLLGKDEAVTHVCARNLVSSISQDAGHKPVLLGLALKDSSIEGIRAMQEMIKSCQVW